MKESARTMTQEEINAQIEAKVDERIKEVLADMLPADEAQVKQQEFEDRIKARLAEMNEKYGMELELAKTEQGLFCVKWGPVFLSESHHPDRLDWLLFDWLNGKAGILAAYIDQPLQRIEGIQKMLSGGNLPQNLQIERQEIEKRKEKSFLIELLKYHR